LQLGATSSKEKFELSAQTHADATVRPLVRAAYMEQRVKFGGEHSWEWPQKLLEDLLSVPRAVKKNSS
jgi:hypothetical protein